MTMTSVIEEYGEKFPKDGSHLKNTVSFSVDTHNSLGKKFKVSCG
tara:strand:+ start:1717 stop:1851 length:135 start_codon:yes stop_codon:yes gene_type:complete